jgi:GNAT superfamily N-acetyltransferase
VYKNGSSRLRPIRIDNTIIFLECNIIKDEVGYVDFMTLDHEKEFHIDYFEVHTLYQKQGYGREIYHWIENYAKHKGIRTIYLTPYKSAVRFWIKLGFLPISHDSDEMIKTITSPVPDTRKDDVYGQIAS